jgi:hypothetical protein
MRLRRLSPSLTPRQCAAVMILARRGAFKIAEQQLRDRGLKPQRMARKEIVALADEYLAERRAQLIAEAAERVARLQAEGFFGKPRANLKTSAQTAKA